MQLKIITFLGFVWISIIQAIELPDDIPKCHYGDYPCMVESANKFIRLYGKRAPDLGIDSLDSIAVDDIMLINSPGHIYFNYNLTNQVVKGFENATITKISGFDREPDKQKIEIELTIPRLLMEGTFSLDVRGLIVYTNTTGRTKSDLQNVRIRSSVKVFVEHRNNKRYLNIYDLSPSIQIDRWILWVDDLYKENTDLTVALIRVVNENWLEFWNEVEPMLIPAYSKSIRLIIQKVVQTVSYDDWFLKD